MKVAAEEVEALPAFPEVDHSGLVRMEAETELAHDRSRLRWACSACALGRAQHHEVVRVADDFSNATLGPGPVEGVQVDVGQQR